MNEPQENKRIDNLFARKLGNMSLPPSADGFERLQARMGHTKPEVKVVFWQNPDVQRYMAMAACLLLVCLFGWLYQSSPNNTNETSSGTQVATNSKTQPTTIIPKATAPTTTEIAQKVEPANPTASELLGGRIADAGKPVRQVSVQTPIRTHTETAARKKAQPVPALANEQPMVAQKSPDEIPTKPTPAVNIQTTPRQLAENTAKPAPMVERGLIVTIEEPAAIVAARQAAKTVAEDKQTTVAVATPTEKEAKSGGLWQQMKKLKQGEVFARSDNSANDERGLLSRAFSGLKNNFDKNDKVQNHE